MSGTNVFDVVSGPQATAYDSPLGSFKIENKVDKAITVTVLSSDYLKRLSTKEYTLNSIEFAKHTRTVELSSNLLCSSSGTILINDWPTYQWAHSHSELFEEYTNQTTIINTTGYVVCPIEDVKNIDPFRSKYTNAPNLLINMTKTAYSTSNSSPSFNGTKHYINFVATLYKRKKKKSDDFPRLQQTSDTKSKAKSKTKSKSTNRSGSIPKLCLDPILDFPLLDLSFLEENMNMNTKTNSRRVQVRVVSSNSNQHLHYFKLKY